MSNFNTNCQASTSVLNKMWMVIIWNDITHKKIMWMLYWRWRCRCILEWPLDSVSKGCGFDSHQCLALLSFSKTLYPHCCSLPRCINGYPVGCEGYVVYVFACNATIGSSARNAPLGVEIVHRKCGLEIASNYQGNNSMLRLEHPRWMNMCTS